MQWHTCRIPMDNWIEKDMSPSSALWNRRFCWIRCTLLCPLETRLHATKNAAKIFVAFLLAFCGNEYINYQDVTEKKKVIFDKANLQLHGGSYDPVDLIFFYKFTQISFSQTTNIPP